MVRINVEAVVDLTAPLPARDGRARPRRDHQHRLDRRLPADAGRGDLRGEQVVRPLLQRGDPDRAARQRRHRSPPSAPARSRPSSPRRPGWAGSRTDTPDADLDDAPRRSAAHAVDGADRDKRVVVPGALNRAQSIVGQHSPRAIALPLIQRDLGIGDLEEPARATDARARGPRRRAELERAGEGAPVLLIHETATSVRRLERGRQGDRRERAPGDRLRPPRLGRLDRARTATSGRRSRSRARTPPCCSSRSTAGPAVLCGAGLGAVIALDLLLRRPELVARRGADRAAAARPAPRGDRGALGRPGRARERGSTTAAPPARSTVYLSGGLPALGAGADRLPDRAHRRRARAARRACSPSSAPRRPGACRCSGSPRRERPSLIVTAPSTPDLLREAPGRSPAAWPRARPPRSRSRGPRPHVGAPEGSPRSRSGG